MHQLILGQTESGKSTLSKILAVELLKRGKKVAILDPLSDPNWVGTFKTDDIEELREYLENERSVYVFIDESGQYFNEGNDASHIWLATRSRHFGHSITFIGQRSIQIPKTMRDQCSRLYLFTSSRTDGKIHVEEWNKDCLGRCNELPQMHFWVVDRYNKCDLMRIHKYKEIVNVNRRNSSDDRGSNRDSDTGNISRSVDRKTGDKN